MCSPSPLMPHSDLPGASIPCFFFLKYGTFLRSEILEGAESKYAWALRQLPHWFRCWSGRTIDRFRLERSHHMWFLPVDYPFLLLLKTRRLRQRASTAIWTDAGNDAYINTINMSKIHIYTNMYNIVCSRVRTHTLCFVLWICDLQSQEP